MSVSSARRSDLTRVSTENSIYKDSPKRVSPKSKIKIRNSATVRRNAPAGDDKAYFRNIGGLSSKRGLKGSSMVIKNDDSIRNMKLAD